MPRSWPHRPPDLSTLGGRLHAARLALHLNQATVAHQVGISQVYLSELERGPKHPSPALLQALAQVFGLNPAWLAHGEPPLLEPALLQALAQHLPALAHQLETLPPDRLDEGYLLLTAAGVFLPFELGIGGAPGEPVFVAELEEALPWGPLGDLGRLGKVLATQGEGLRRLAKALEAQQRQGPPLLIDPVHLSEQRLSWSLRWILLTFFDPLITQALTTLSAEQLSAVHRRLLTLLTKAPPGLQDWAALGRLPGSVLPPLPSPERLQTQPWVPTLAGVKALSALFDVAPVWLLTGQEPQSLWAWLAREAPTSFKPLVALAGRPSPAPGGKRSKGRHTRA